MTNDAPEWHTPGLEPVTDADATADNAAPVRNAFVSMTG